MKIKDFATVPEAAKICNLPVQTLRDATAAGHIPSQRTAGGTIVLRLADVRRYREHRPRTGPRGPRSAAK